MIHRIRRLAGKDQKVHICANMQENGLAELKQITVVMRVRAGGAVGQRNTGIRARIDVEGAERKRGKGRVRDKENKKTKK